MNREIDTGREPVGFPRLHLLEHRARHHVGRDQQGQLIEAAALVGWEVLEPEPGRHLGGTARQRVPRRVAERGPTLDHVAPERKHGLVGPPGFGGWRIAIRDAVFGCGHIGRRELGVRETRAFVAERAERRETGGGAFRTHRCLHLRDRPSRPKDLHLDLDCADRDRTGEDSVQRAQRLAAPELGLHRARCDRGDDATLRCHHETPRGRDHGRVEPVARPRHRGGVPRVGRHACEVTALRYRPSGEGARGARRGPVQRVDCEGSSGRRARSEERLEARRRVRGSRGR